MIRFWCPCGRQLQASANHIGQVASCPMCGQTSVVPPLDVPQRRRRTKAGNEARRYPSADPRPKVVVPDLYGEPPQPRPRSGMAALAGILGIASFMLPFYAAHPVVVVIMSPLFLVGFVTGIPPVIVGILALRQRG